MPRPARFATQEIILIDLSVRGAGIRHHKKLLPQTKGVLTFRLERRHHEIPCIVARSRLELVKQGDKTLQIFRSALGFEALEESLDSIRAAIRKRVERAITRQKADALGQPELMNGIDESSGAIPIDLLASWMETRPFIRCSLDKNGRWKYERAESSEQPPEGFTVSAEETDKEIDLLKMTYEKARPDQRKLIKIFAQLALSDPSDEPRGRYEP